MSKNFITITGNLGNDVELKIVKEGKKVCNFSLAESYPTSKKDENGKTIYKTRWHKVTAWDGLAQKMADASLKGQPVMVSGYLDYEDYEVGDKTIQTAKIVADDINLFAFYNTSAVKEAKNSKREPKESDWRGY